MAQFTDFFTAAQVGINATTTSVNAATTKALDVSMREQIGIIFTAASISAGDGLFSVDGSNDGTNWTTGLAMVDAKATATTTYVTSKDLTTNTSAAVYLPLFPFRFIRVILVVTTDGTYTATIMAKG